MKVVAIIAEYNPFHMGHLYQLSEIRRRYGDDTAVIAVMSGNYVQRGECAAFDKFLRARAAVLCGVNLVLELPFPFCVSGAGYFADKAVALISALDIADVLAFGCESGELDTLTALSDATQSKRFELTMKTILSDKEKKNLGYARVRENALLSIADKETLRAPNNLLAIEYLAALKRRQCKIEPFAVKRSCPHDSDTQENGYASASLIRSLLAQGEVNKAFSFVPPQATAVFEQADAFPRTFTQDRFSDVTLAAFRLNGLQARTFEMTEELLRRLTNASKKATSYHDLIEQTRTARYTTARVRRAVLHAMMGTTSAQLASDPLYSQLLACDGVGMSLLKKIKQKTAFPILTKPADTQKLHDAAKAQADFCAKADAVFGIFRGTAQAGDTFVKATPFCAR